MTTEIAKGGRRSPWQTAKEEHRMLVDITRWAVLLLEDLRKRGRIGRGEFEAHMSNLYDWSNA